MQDIANHSDTPYVRKLFADFNIQQVNANRAINCKGFKTCRPTELVISNYQTNHD
jgi:hypothetical protein